MFTDFLHFLDNNAITVILIMATLIVSYGISTFFRITLTKKLSNRVFSIEKYIESEKKKSDPYHVLFQIHENEIELYKKNPNYKHLYNDDKLINFLFSKTKILVKITEYLYNIDYMEININTIFQEFGRARELISYAAKQISREFYEINRDENTEIFQKLSTDIIRILQDKIRNGKQEKILEIMKIAVSDTILMSNIAYAKYLATECGLENDFDKSIKDNKLFEAAIILQRTGKRKNEVLNIMAQISDYEIKDIEGRLSEDEKKKFRSQIITSLQKLNEVIGRG